MCCNSQWRAHDRRRTAAVKAAHGHDMGGAEDELQPLAHLHVSSSRWDKSRFLSPWKALFFFFKENRHYSSGHVRRLRRLSVWNQAGIQVGVSRLAACRCRGRAPRSPRRYPSSLSRRAAFHLVLPVQTAQIVECLNDASSSLNIKKMFELRSQTAGFWPCPGHLSLSGQLGASLGLFLPDGGDQHWLVGPDVRGPATPAGGWRPGGGGRGDGAEHAAAEAEEQHLVSHPWTSSVVCGAQMLPGLLTLVVHLCFPGRVFRPKWIRSW